MITESGKKCVIYVRASSINQTSEGTGLSSQEDSCRTYAKEMGYEVLGVFKDVISGTVGKRAGTTELVKFLRKNQGQGINVIVDDVDRFARDVAVYSDLSKQITSLGAFLASPKFAAPRDANTRFFLHLKAALAELEVNTNAERGQRRLLARLQQGFWTFRDPAGYDCRRDPAKGMVLRPVPPLSEIITEGLEGFATGRFQTQSEVKRFFETKPEFPKDFDGKYVKLDRVTRILTNVLYAGYIDRPERNVAMVKAQHTPLISYSTFRIIQSRLSGAKVAPARKDIDLDFPLRGFLTCAECGHKLTSCWSRSRTGKRYPYYLCQYRTCRLKGKSVPKGKLEGDFTALLKGLQVVEEAMALTKSLFEKAWNTQLDRNRAEADRLKTILG